MVMTANQPNGSSKCLDVDLARIFPINERVQLNIDGRTYASRVEDVYPDHVVVAAPIHRGKIVSTRKDSSVTVGVVYKDTYHEFDGRIGEELRGQVPTIVLSHLHSCVQPERRHYIRINHVVSVNFRLSTATGPWEVAESIDIGGGGIRVARSIDTRIASGDIVDVRLFIPGLQQISAACRVLRVNHTAGVGGPYGYWAAEFTQIPPKNRSDLVRYVEKVFNSATG